MSTDDTTTDEAREISPMIWSDGKDYSIMNSGDNPIMFEVEVIGRKNEADAAPKSVPESAASSPPATDVPPPLPPDVDQPPKPKLTPGERMAKARAARKIAAPSADPASAEKESKDEAEELF